jgi:response regulator RpfG family c-di-GMP phosphodiesterase
MADKFVHTVLIVDDEAQIGKALGRLMRSIGAKYVYAESGQAAIDAIKAKARPFSLILSDQRMPGMEGSEFLEQAKKLSPDTIRFLITGYADVNAVTDAVNKGSIHRYITKPWDNRMLTEIIKAGLEQYELIMENNRLFALAKEQNAKLYKINTGLKKSAELHKRAILQKDKKIAELTEQLEKGFKPRDYISEIETLLKENHMLDSVKLQSLYAAVVAELYEQFQDIAARNGFEMPEDVQGELDAG